MDNSVGEAQWREWIFQNMLMVVVVGVQLSCEPNVRLLGMTISPSQSLSKFYLVS